MKKSNKKPVYELPKPVKLTAWKSRISKKFTHFSFTMLNEPVFGLIKNGVFSPYISRYNKHTATSCLPEECDKFDKAMDVALEQGKVVL